MITLGIILAIIGFLVGSLSWLLWVGIVLIVVGLILNLIPIGGGRHRVF